MRHHICCDRPAIDRVDPLAGLSQKTAVFILKGADIADLTGHARSSESFGKNLKLPVCGILQIIYDRDMRVFYSFFAGAVKFQKSLYPGIKQFKRLKVIHPGDRLMRGIVHQCFTQLQIPDHGCRAVCIDLAELKISGIFIVKEIQPGNGKHTFIRRRQKDQFLQLPGERKQPADSLFPAITLNHFSENTAAHLHDLLKVLYGFLIKHFGDMYCFVQYSLIIER